MSAKVARMELGCEPTVMAQPPADAFELFDLSRRVAVVTGAPSGLGAGIARALAGAGATVAVVARRADRLEALAAEIGGAAFACDLLASDAVDALVPAIADAVGPPTILVNAAGAIVGGNAAEDEPLDAIR